LQLLKLKRDKLKASLLQAGFLPNFITKAQKRIKNNWSTP